MELLTYTLELCRLVVSKTLCVSEVQVRAQKKRNIFAPDCVAA